MFRNSRIEDSVLAKRDQTLRNVEERINIGVRRQLNAIVGYIRHLLTSTQKKTVYILNLH